MLPRGVAALLLAVLVAAACGSDGEPEGPVEHTGSDDGFYEPPDPLPDGEHGDLLRYQRVDVTADAYRVLYLSESVPGEPIAVSGLVVLPSGGEGVRPVLSWAHGTTGLADQCAPSKHPLGGRVSSLLVRFIERGWAVVATDYEGLGTPGLHPYLAGISEGRGTLDIVRAAKQLPGAALADDTVIWGHSQGGHAALFAHELAGSWTPELRVRGTVAGAPPSELPLIGAVGRDGFQGYLAMAVAGLNAAHPEAHLSSVLRDEAIARLVVLEQGCADEVFARYNHLSYEDVARPGGTTTEPWKSVLEKNDPGHVRVDSPLLIIHGEADQVIPIEASRLLFERLCGLGQLVERRTYPGLGHGDVIESSFSDMVTWMDDRVAGQPAVTGCPTG